MAVAAAVRFSAKLGQGLSALGVSMFACGFLGWILALFHLPSSLLLNLGLVALPFVFAGLLLLFIAALLERFLMRRRLNPTAP
ncbi:MAG TPA: hypothetical protein VHX37_02230 [Acidobacteriaceae bacterium]|jgi:hypothetical protein|nr:hypothetical protein [Acidobacteriaceae bacterium]